MKVKFVQMLIMLISPNFDILRQNTSKTTTVKAICQTFSQLLL